MNSLDVSDKNQPVPGLGDAPIKEHSAFSGMRQHNLKSNRSYDGSASRSDTSSAPQLGVFQTIFLYAVGILHLWKPDAKLFAAARLLER